jgi:hypothetical protein
MSCGVHWGCTDIRGDLEQEAEKWQAPQFEKNFHSSKRRMRRGRHCNRKQRTPFACLLDSC